MTWPWIVVVVAGLALWIWLRWEGRGPRERPEGSVTLREIDNPEEGFRHLVAYGAAGGGLRIEGVDRGDEVERIWGEREYEWIITLEAPAVRKLLTALGAQGDALPALEQRFGGERSSDLNAFLDEHEIPYDFWSRHGD